MVPTDVEGVSIASRNFQFPQHGVCKWSDACKDRVLTFDHELCNSSMNLLATSLTLS